MIIIYLRLQLKQKRILKNKIINVFIIHISQNLPHFSNKNEKKLRGDIWSEFQKLWQQKESYNNFLVMIKHKIDIF